MQPETCGVVGLAFLGGSYMAEAFRSGLESVAKIQSESALSLGMNRAQVMRYIVLPQAVSVSIPGICGKCYLLIKGDKCIQCHQFDGSHVYGKGSDRTLL